MNKWLNFGGIWIATLVRRALAEVCTVPVFLVHHILIIGSVCLCQAASVCATVSASINPLPSDRLRCCNRYIWCQQSLAVKPLNNRPAIGDAVRPSHRPPLMAVWNTAGQPASAVALAMSRYQFTHVRYQTAAAGRVRWLACAALLGLTPQAAIALCRAKQSAIVACIW